MQFLDTLQNLVSGLFTAKDKASADTFVFAQLSPMELEAAYRGGGFARKIVDIPPFDMTRAWRNWQAEGPQIEAIEAEEKRLDIRRKVKRAMQLARVWGGAAIIIGYGDADPSQPAPKTIGRGGIKFLTVVPRRELSTGEIDRDPMSPFYGEPTKYVIASQTSGSVDIHPSRVIRFVGAAYLLWLAYKAFRNAVKMPELHLKQVPSLSAWRAGLTGFTLQITNPKAILFWLAIASVGGVGNAPAYVIAIFIVGAFVNSFIGHGGYALLLSSGPVRRVYFRFRRWVEAALGGFFAVASYTLATSR